MILLSIVIVLLLVLINGYFVAAEFSLVKIRRGQIEAAAAEGNRLAKMTVHVTDHLDIYLSACQLGITLASLALGWVGEPMVASLLEPMFEHLGIAAEHVHYVAFPIAFATITFLHISIGEQVPKMLAITRERRVALFCAPPLIGFYTVFKPFIWVLNSASNLMLRMVGIAAMDGHGSVHTEEEVRVILTEAAMGGQLTRAERAIMENALDLEDKSCRQYMLPRTAIVSLNLRDDLAENLRLASRCGHSRLPLCDGDLDHTIGVLHTKDLLRAVSSGEEISDLRDLARDAIFVPDIANLRAVMTEFQKRRGHIALVVDEYGGTSGMITLDNVLEQLVGPIQDEFDDERPAIRKLGKDRFEIDGNCPVDAVAERCGLVLPETSADSIGGLITALLGHLPACGEQVTCGKHTLTVVATEGNRVATVKLEGEVAADPEPTGEANS